MFVGVVGLVNFLAVELRHGFVVVVLEPVDPLRRDG